jgi:mannitol dehydrogenase domain protein
MKLCYEGLKDQDLWASADVKLPEFDWKAMCLETEKSPVWVHFGAGNIFRGFIARLQQELLNKGLAKSGIVAADTFDYGIIDEIYSPHDSMTLLVSLLSDGKIEKEIVASIAKGIRAGNAYPEDMEQLRAVFRKPTLQMVSFTITEKGYSLTNIQGDFLPFVESDFKKGPSGCSHAMCIVTSLLLERFNAGGFPLAVVSMDNCSRNGEKLRAGIMTVVDKWLENGFITEKFADWVRNESNVSFPWTMIDKITPRPAKAIEEALTASGIEDMAPIVTEKNTFIAPFVNAEKPQYLVIEDNFPNGRPPLEEAGVYMTDRETVNNTEKMKVMTCLNPLHTALAVYGCLLGYNSIADEMKDNELRALVEKIGYDEGMPVVIDPKIINPSDFIHEVVEKRLPNPFVPDSPQRIATDTSQKMSVRFGETIKAYVQRNDLDVTSLTFIPLAIAGWLRYLLEVDDFGNEMVCSGDPMFLSLKKELEGVKIGNPESLNGKLTSILSNNVIFGCDLMKIGLGKKIEQMVREEIESIGAVRKTLKKYLEA